MNEKHKKVYRALSYFENFIIFISAVSGCVSLAAFASLVGVPIGITSSVIRLNIYAITAGIKKSIVKMKKRSMPIYYY